MTRRTWCVVGVALMLAFASVWAQTQVPVSCTGPLTFPEMVKLLSGHVAEKRVIQHVATCGVAFELTDERETILRSANGTDAVIAAVRDKVRSAAEAKATSDRIRGEEAARRKRVAEEGAWELVKDSRDAAILEAFLTSYAAGAHADEAKQQLAALQAAARVGDLRWVMIPAGVFMMGCTTGDTECIGWERPRHEVRLTKGFELMVTEVTVRQFRASGIAWRNRYGNRVDDGPVVDVTWEEALGFCAAVGGRLPTEAEWEYAARGGLKDARYPWGNDGPVDDARASNGARYAGIGEAVVGSYSANGYGLYDMAGNVSEWVADWYAPAYEDSTSVDPTGPTKEGVSRAIRGGSYPFPSDSSRVSSRHFLVAGIRSFGDVGFRCARDLPAGSQGNELVQRAAEAMQRRRKAEADAWELVKDTTAAASLQTFLKEFPAGWHAEQARTRLAALQPSPKSASDLTSLRWVRIPSGTFVMGCSDEEPACGDDWKPAHTVRLTRRFELTATEVTVGQFRASPKAVPSQPSWSKRDDQPVVDVTWEEAGAFCRAVGGRLPTEAEWEYAARGGRKGWPFVWGTAVTPIVNGRPVANLADESMKRKYPSRANTEAGYDDGYPETSPVGSFPANAFGLYDMAGNVAEWVADHYDEKYYRESPPIDPPGPSLGQLRVMRGGSFSEPVGNTLVAFRDRMELDWHSYSVGFRCARDVSR